MQAILYIGHGSRNPDSVCQLTSFIRGVMKEIPCPIQEISFLELSHPTIAEGVERCVKRGAIQIAVVPFLLLTASHAKVDIPQEIKEMEKRFPHVTFHYGRPIGVHAKMIDLLKEKITTYRNACEEACVVLIGRGSSDYEQLQDLRRIVAMLKKELPSHRIKMAFLHGGMPSLAQGLQHAKESRIQKIIVVPYILFPGVLLRKINESVMKHFDSTYDVHVCTPLGYHPYLKDVLKERVHEIVEINKIRQYA